MIRPPNESDPLLPSTTGSLNQSINSILVSPPGEDAGNQTISSYQSINSIPVSPPGEDTVNQTTSGYGSREGTEVIRTYQTGLYRRRWYILFVFSMCSFTQSLLWNTWGPIAASTEFAFGWTNVDIAVLALWGPIAFCLTVYLFSWIVQTKGYGFYKNN